MTNAKTASWPQVVRRRTILVVVLIGLLGVAASAFVLWNQEQSKKSHDFSNDYHLASAFRSSSAREEIIDLLRNIEAEPRHVQGAADDVPFGTSRPASINAAIYVIQQNASEVLELQRRFGDPRFASLSQRLEQRLAALRDDVNQMRPVETISPQAYQSLSSLSTILAQLEKLHTITYDELLASHTHISTRNAVAFIAFVLMVVLIAIVAIRSWLQAIDNVVANQQSAEEAQRRSDARFRSAFENVRVGNVIFSDAGTIQTCNSEAERVFGCAKDEIVGRNIKDLIIDADWSAVDTAAGTRSRGDAKRTDLGTELSGIRKNGDVFPMHFLVSDMPTEDAKLFVGSVTDLSEIKALEQKLFRSQRLEAVGQLTGGVAHDFNNVMTTILGNAESLMEMAGEGGKARSLAAAIVRAVDRGRSLTQRLLAFSRQQVLSPVSVDVSDLVEGLADMLRRTLGESIDLKIVRTPLPWPAHVDPNQFESALVNLVLNARDAMTTGGVLRIGTCNVVVGENNQTTVADLAPGEYVVVTVSDDGEGMPAEILEKVFEPFFTTKEVGKGSGLGLSMVYGFAKQSRGHVAIASAPGKGTTVELYLPRSEEVPESTTTHDVAMPFSAGTGRTLVVEDDPDFRKIATEILEKHGYRVLEAGDGDEALRLLKEDPDIDLLFTDVVLPGGRNGVEIAETARRRHPRIKVLYTSGYTENATVQERPLAADAVFVSKPYRRNELLEKVRGVLAGESPRLAQDGAAIGRSVLGTGPQ